MEICCSYHNQLAKSISLGDMFHSPEWIETPSASITAIAFALVSIIISCVHIMRHLRHYTMPQVQIYVIRILLTCPMYAVTSSIALTMGPYGLYAEVVRDVYEAFVIYSFLNLILEYSGGENDCVHAMENEAPLRLPMPLCCLKPKPRDTRLMRFCSQGVLQFIITKPAVAAVDLILLALGKFYDSIWQMVVAVIYNISYIWALYCLYVFYLATKNTIKTFRPVAKFATVKSIIFATYYQSLFLQLSMSDPELAFKWNDLLLCVEMVFFAAALMVAFPVKDFQGGMPNRRVLENIKDVMTVRDIYQDVYHNFNNRYQDYALQRSESEAAATGELHSYFSNNLDTVALEMTERYRGRSRRLAFNSLLRGSQPIRAKLRSTRNMEMLNEDDEEEDEEDCMAMATTAAAEQSTIGKALSAHTVVYSTVESNPLRASSAVSTAVATAGSSSSDTSKTLITSSNTSSTTSAVAHHTVPCIEEDSIAMDTSSETGSDSNTVSAMPPTSTVTIAAAPCTECISSGTADAEVEINNGKDYIAVAAHDKQQSKAGDENTINSTVVESPSQSLTSNTSNASNTSNSNSSSNTAATGSAVTKHNGALNGIGRLPLNIRPRGSINGGGKNSIQSCNSGNSGNSRSNIVTASRLIATPNEPRTTTAEAGATKTAASTISSTLAADPTVAAVSSRVMSYASSPSECSRGSDSSASRSYRSTNNSGVNSSASDSGVGDSGAGSNNRLDIAELHAGTADTIITAVAVEVEVEEEVEQVEVEQVEVEQVVEEEVEEEEREDAALVPTSSDEAEVIGAATAGGFVVVPADRDTAATAAAVDSDISRESALEWGDFY